MGGRTSRTTDKKYGYYRQMFDIHSRSNKFRKRFGKSVFDHTNDDKYNYYDRVVYISGQPYKFKKRLGKGGFGSVYAARAPDGTPRAIKVIDIQDLPTEEGKFKIDSYLNEVRLLNQLRKETRHAVRIYDFDFDQSSGQAYIVMELGNENLATIIERLHEIGGSDGIAIDSTMMKEFWRQMLNIIYILHTHSIVHMDFKPDNLILFGATLKIADLGISRKVHVLGDAQVGTWQFSAPEVMEDVANTRRYYGPEADVWSLGAILYSMAYGVPPEYRPGNQSADPPFGYSPHPDPYLNDVLRRTLVRNPLKRADLNTLFNHPFTQS